MKRFVAGIVNVDKSLYVVAGAVPASSPQGVTGKATLFNEILTNKGRAIADPASIAALQKPT